MATLSPEHGSLRLTWHRMLVLAVTSWLGACATVEPEEREHLAKPAMTFGSESLADSQDEHAFANREGSYGAGTVRGGGCGCN